MLGPRGYSEITTLFSYLSLTSIPTLVVSSFIVQKVASTRSNKLEYVFTLEELFWRKIKNYWYVLIGFLLLTPYVAKFTNLSPITGIVVIPLIILSFVSTFYGASLQGLNYLILYSLIGILAVVIKLLGPVLIFLGIDGFSTLILFLLLSSLIPLLVIYISIRLQFKKNIVTPITKIEKKIRSLIYNPQFLLILASTLALNLFNNFDVIFVKKFFTSQDAGIYGAWSLLAKIVLYGIGPMISVSFIFFSGQKKKNRDIFRISVLILAIIGFLSITVYSFFARFIVNFFFGDRFMSVLPYLSRAAVFGSLYSMLTFINNYYLAKKSKISLILPVLIPVYLFFIFLIKKDLNSVIWLNIIFSFTALLLHLVFYLKTDLNSDSEAA